jgi:ethanolamine utilization protein EutM
MKYSGAVAVVEVAGLPTAIACADAMVKAANVTLIGYEITKGGPGMVNVKICGDVGAVQAAVDAGCAVANQITRVMSKVIMPRPHTDLERMLLDRNKEAFFSRKFDTQPQPLAEESPASVPMEAAKDKEISEAKQEINGKSEGPVNSQLEAGDENKGKETVKTKTEAKQNTHANDHKKNNKDNPGKK